MTTLGKKIPIPIIPSVNPIEDSTELDTVFFTDVDKVRFVSGKLTKLRGWQRIFFDSNLRIEGAARNIFSYRDNDNQPITLIGTHRSLYALMQGNALYNITPLSTTFNSIPDSISTEYHSNVSVDVITGEGSNVVVLFIDQYLRSDDNIVISGVTGGDINGIPASDFNNTFNVFVDNNRQIRIYVNTPATSTGVETVTMTWAASYIKLNIPGHNCLKGDRVKIKDSTDVGNILASSINMEAMISGVIDRDNIVVNTDTIATSYVTGGGGSSTAIAFQIPEGNISESVGYGYGGGPYGVGLYGVPAEFTDNNTYSVPRIWSIDTWQDSAGNLYAVMTPGDDIGSSSGDGANLYSWGGDPAVAPTLITNAPKFVGYVFVSHNCICTLGGAFSPATEGISTFFAASDVGDMTKWTPSPSNYSFFATVSTGTGLISHAPARDVDLLFTDNEVYKLRYVDKPDIWRIEPLFASDGIISPKARAVVEDMVLWMGDKGFYVYNNYTISVLPDNTLKRHVYDNLNRAHVAKCFGYNNSLFNEVWFFYPSGSDNEVNNYIIFNYTDGNFSMGTMRRSAAEEFMNNLDHPYLIESRIERSLKPESIESYFYELSDDPFTTTSGSKTVTLNKPPDFFLKAGDYIEFAGSLDVNGIPAGDINGVRKIKSVTSVITLEDLATAASSSGTGGGADVTMGTAVFSLDIKSSRIDVNEETRIDFAPDIGGIDSIYLNGYGFTVRSLSGTKIYMDNLDPDSVFSSSKETKSIDDVVLYYTASNRLFVHEVGVNAYNDDYVYGSDESDQAPMLSYFVTNMAQVDEGDNTQLIYSVYPDTNQKENLTLTVSGRLYAQSSLINPTFNTIDGTYNVTPDTSKVDIMFVTRQRQYKVESNVLNGDFMIGKWFEEIKPLGAR